jgi:hypothetical protein
MDFFTAEAPSMLTAQERHDFSRLDADVAMAAKASKVVVKGGQALAEIRDRQLFRDVAKTWEAYVERHGLTKRRADQMVAFAHAVEVVETEMGTAVPILTERALRPVAGMDAGEVKEVIREAAAEPAGLTAKTIRKAAAKRKAKGTRALPRPVRVPVPGGTVIIELNRKAAAAGTDVEKALEMALDRIRSGRREAA